MSILIRSLLSDASEEKKHFFDAIRYWRQQTAQKQRLTYSWKDNNYKIYPSGLSSVSMCPYRYVHEDVHKPPVFPTEALYKMSVGNALHEMYQNDAMNVERLLWPKPTVPDFLQEKLESSWPEVPVADPESGISGRADLVLDQHGLPVVLDIKTTSIPVEKWNADYFKKLPYKNQMLQVGIYIHLMNKYGYYVSRISRGVLGYVNVLLPAGHRDAEIEKYFDYDDTMEENISLLIEHLSKERKAFIEGRGSSCSYPRCRIHAK